MLKAKLLIENSGKTFNQILKNLHGNFSFSIVTFLKSVSKCRESMEITFLRRKKLNMM